MRRLFGVLLFGGALALPVAQGLPSFDPTVDAVLFRYGDQISQAVNFQLRGTITYAGKLASPFVLTSQKQQLRFEVTKPEGVLTIVRQDQKTQAVRGQNRGLPERSPLSSAGVNITPVFALLNFKADRRFTGSVVQAEDGMLGSKLFPLRSRYGLGVKCPDCRSYRGKRDASLLRREPFDGQRLLDQLHRLRV